MTVTTAAPPPPPPSGPDDRFVRPRVFWNLLLQPGLVALTAMSLSPTVYDAAAARLPVPPRRTIRAITIGAYGLHSFEAAVAFRRARRAGLQRSAGRWALETFLLGFPVLLKLRALDTTDDAGLSSH